MTPKIHFRHQRINSNLAALYSRSSNQIFFSLEKEF
ncbi:surface lipoprotein assembly modifier [Oligella urethralis]|nr:hypothetical protein CJ230_03255 [Oligella urethralis]